MQILWHRYRAILVAGIFLLLITIVLQSLGFILIDPREVAENTIIFSLWWGLLSFVFFKIDHAENKGAIIGPAVALIGLLVLAISLDTRMNIPDNPVTVTLVTLFWMYLAYVLSPTFVRKHRVFIVMLYGLLCLGFAYVRLTNPHYRDWLGFFIPAFLLPIPLLILLWLYEQWKWFQTLKADKAKAELALLKSQINPHFFFNTLNNLYALTINQSPEAPEVILKLAEMMRYVIYDSREAFVPLEQEVRYLQNFIELHQIRHHQQVDVQFRQHTAPGMYIAPLLLMILVENAFKHGVERQPENAFVHLDLETTAQTIVFRVTNSQELASAPTGGGIGLENLRKRLALIYPKKHTLILQTTPGVFVAELQIQVV
ncbi:MAG: sensor histidine kinase [Lewinellaceae bacterium]|nr:sensor histidine kinase [Lewinellaceae bacterium]